MTPPGPRDHRGGRLRQIRQVLREQLDIDEQVAAFTARAAYKDASPRRPAPSHLGSPGPRRRLRIVMPTRLAPRVRFPADLPADGYVSRMGSEMSDSDCLIVPSIRHRVRLRPVAAHGVPTGAGAGWLTPERYDSRMHHFEPSRPAAAASERERAVAETARPAPHARHPDCLQEATGGHQRLVGRRAIQRAQSRPLGTPPAVLERLANDSDAAVQRAAAHCQAIAQGGCQQGQPSTANRLTTCQCQ